MQALWNTWSGQLRGMSMIGTLPTRYEAVDPTVQEIAILAAMHNMASMLKSPQAIKALLNAEIAERSKKLAEGS